MCGERGEEDLQHSPQALWPAAIFSASFKVKDVWGNGRDAQNDALTPALPGITRACCIMLALLSSLLSTF